MNPLFHQRTLVVAEAGVNHNGDLKLALRLIEAAQQAGADYVKFQTFKPEQVISSGAAKADYQLRLTQEGESQLEMARKLELSREEHFRLQEHAHKVGIKLASTAFDLPSLELIQELNFDFLKVPSGEVTHKTLLQAIGRAGKPVVLSTGMCNLAEVQEAVAVLEHSGLLRQDLAVLQCNTEYPTPPEDVHLRAMLTLGQTLGCAYGYSDHTQGTCIPVAAVALGACFIEKHLTLDRNLPGPDHQASLEPQEFRRMVEEIRIVQKALGRSSKELTPSEAKNRDIARRSVVAACPIRQGEPLSLDKLICKRPGQGLNPMKIEALLGLPANRDYAPDELLDLALLK